MKKFYSFLFAAVALVGFAACNSDNTEEPAPAGVEKVSFKANIDDTKTGLDANNKTTWEVDDQVKIGDYTFTYDGTEFSCTEPGVTTLLGQTVTATYSKNGDGKIDSTAGTAGAVLVAANQKLNEVEPTLNFAVTSAFLKFTTAGTVTLKGAGLFYYEGAAKDEITFEEAGTYYVAINPATDVNFTVSSHGATIKNKTLSFAKKTIYNLGEFTPFNLYIEDNSGYNKMCAYAFGDGEVLGTWPGTETQVLETPVEKDGKTYTKVMALSDKVSAGGNYKFILNNGGMGSQYNDFVPGAMSGDMYYTAYPKNLVYIKKAGRVNSWTDIYCFMWISEGNNNWSWPGIKVDTSRTYAIYEDKPEEFYYLYDAGDNKEFKYLIIHNNNGEQTVDTTIPTAKIGKTIGVEVTTNKDNNKFKTYIW